MHGREEAAPNKPAAAPPKAKPSPKPDTLKLDVPWEDAVKTALQKTKPAGGWPKDDPQPLAYGLFKEKLPKDQSYPLKRSLLDAAFAAAGITCIHHVHYGRHRTPDDPDVLYAYYNRHCRPDEPCRDGGPVRLLTAERVRSAVHRAARYGSRHPLGSPAAAHPVAERNRTIGGRAGRAWVPGGTGRGAVVLPHFLGFNAGLQ